MDYTNLNKIVDEWAADVIDRVQFNIDNRMSSRAKMRGGTTGGANGGLNATRKLRQGFKPDIKHLGDEINIKIGWDNSDVDYAGAVDKGRRAGDAPPTDKIMKWITDKGIKVPPPSKLRTSKIKGLKSKTVKKAFKQQSEETRRRGLAYVIARRIGQYGTEPTNFYSDVVNDKLFDNLKLALKVAFKKDILIDLKKD